MGTIQKINRLAAVCLFALTAAFTSASAQSVAAPVVPGDQAQVAIGVQNQNGQAGENRQGPEPESASAAQAAEAQAKKEATDATQAANTDTKRGNDGAQPAAIVPRRDFSNRNAQIGDEGPMFGGAFWHRIFRDEKTIWLSPFHLQGSDMLWVAPLVGGTAALMPFDTRSNKGLPNTTTQFSIAKYVSQMGAAYTVAGIAVGTLLIGKMTDNPKTRETGLMATEALIHSEIVMTVMKAAAGRTRPMLADGTMSNGAFGHPSADGSFPSGHSMSAWALASVFAHQYGDSKWVPFVSYGLATAVSMSRVAGQKHFPSDVLAGSAIGFLMGRFVYRQHQRDLLAREQKWKKAIPTVAPAFAHGGIGVSLNWNLDKRN